MRAWPVAADQRGGALSELLRSRLQQARARTQAETHRTAHVRAGMWLSDCGRWQVEEIAQECTGKVTDHGNHRCAGPVRVVHLDLRRRLAAAAHARMLSVHRVRVSLPPLLPPGAVWAAATARQQPCPAVR